MHERISRQQALDAGLARFFTGIPCRRGHVSERYLIGGSCTECTKLTKKLWPRKTSKIKCNKCDKPVLILVIGLCQAHYAEMRRRARGAKPKIYLTPEQRIEHTRASSRRFNLKNRERQRKYASAYQRAHPERIRAKGARWRAANLERAREIGRRFMKAHPEINALRSSRLVKAMPAWANENKISEMYKARLFAEEVFGVSIHVDHIVPLNSKLVCGLHCEDNLQLLTQVENTRKLNRRWPDMWSN